MNATPAQTDVAADVVVAGAGGAGLAAALATGDAGLATVLLEARETFRDDSNTAMSTSMIPAAGTPAQAAAGVEDSPERFRDDIMKKTDGKADPTVTDALLAAGPPLVEWLIERWRIPLELSTEFLYPGHTALRCHTVHDRAGSTLHRFLMEALATLDDVLMACPARLVGVEVDEGRVVAAHVERPDGTSERIVTPAVVLATNGFGANAELVSRHCPEIVEGLYFGGEGSTGDALAIGETLGADTACLDAYQGHGSVAHPHGVLLTWGTVVQGAVLVNERGERFADESPGYSELACAVLEQPNKRAWMLYDTRIDAALRTFADYQRCLEADAVREAGDLEELAQVIGCETETLARTVAAATAFATGAEADPFGRAAWEAPLAAPYRAVQVTGALFHTQGGLMVDAHAQVLARGTPVQGLYAAGGAAVGISGHGAAGYLAGNGLLAALGLGYIAGMHVAASVR
ncbi:MAG: FAD-dependent oxidoreductase [Gaiellaceae bacterium]